MDHNQNTIAGIYHQGTIRIKFHLNNNNDHYYYDDVRPSLYVGTLYSVVQISLLYS